MLNCSFVKSDCPVRRIVANRRRNMEPLWQLGVNANFVCRIQILSKSALYTLVGSAVGKNVILDRLFCFIRLIKALRIFSAVKISLSYSPAIVL